MYTVQLDSRQNRQNRLDMLGGYSPRFVEDIVHVYTVQSDSRQNRQNRLDIWGGFLGLGLGFRV